MAKRMPRDPEKERSILDAAVKQFGADGFNASTDKIAELAGVSKGSVFRYFENKKKLYVAAVNKAMATLLDVVDLSVWTDSDDLVTMIIRATRYKTELSHQYPSEFALLTRVYAQDNLIPQKVRQQVFKIFTDWQTEVEDTVVTRMIDKMPIRKDLNRDHVKKYMTMVLGTISAEVQQRLEEHPEMKKIEDMDEIIADVKEYLEMAEFGIVASD
ncbi:HTH-type transcriptional regulator RutR [Lentilactobacillus sunkii]|jgi:TetR/AcrR family transcriptional regulator|uniref:HTH-type transcriptional regulator RutR n=1 Tax=Lentilactobacillus sunkii TaxID=481719 RepID=A0A1E7XHH5_9LACO|nr:TetR/AcrR family transcriptional regulator [Lentilactobacillus sunkii]OFA12554.1 HTH-type transcriptional regulator RutR [Lentilactobacillus sunkii]